MTRGILATIQPSIIHLPFAYPKIPKTYTTRLVCGDCQILMKPEFSRQVFEKSSNIKSCENRSEGADLFHADGRT